MRERRRSNSISGTRAGEWGLRKYVKKGTDPLGKGEWVVSLRMKTYLRDFWKDTFKDGS